MKVLVIGGGGREHAMAWKIAQSERIQVVFVAPGNGGTAQDSRMQNVPLSAPDALLEFALNEKIDLTLVGPEAPLAEGVVDIFRANGLKIFGPTKAAAQLESSKDFSKAFMVRHGIPTAEYQTFSDIQAAHDYVDLRGAPIVIKADGLAAGKGVVVATSLEQAHAAVDMMLLDNKFGDAGAQVVIEDCLEGEEVSFMVMVDGENILPLATSQDHKRLKDQDEGPNTGGMGAYSPAPIVTPELHARIMREVIRPTVEGMAKDGIPFTGFLYAGLMIDAQGKPRTLEFNCRMGDPETQPILARLKSDFLTVLNQAVNVKLDEVELQWDPRMALGVVMAADNYPETPRKGDAIVGVPQNPEDGYVFHAGTALENGELKTSGGRVLCAVGLGNGIRMAQRAAYKLVDEIQFDGAQYRTDIGYRALNRKD